MPRMITEMRERLRSRVGIYGTGWRSESIMGLLLPFIIVGILAFIGWLLIAALNSM